MQEDLLALQQTMEVANDELASKDDEINDTNEMMSSVQQHARDLAQTKRGNCLGAGGGWWWGVVW